ncbi:putative pentatricopeptide [Medicago truncatula]|uniref:PPR containing plant-like protein n=1 Tax=Medicago truncatula TaxID=3880 RepID=G7KC93_MEDTR|nr:pentatricopeptide repeat-containing protein At4g38150 [Medicago truncatula]AES94925.2 PPR containing plant-like protein [Medicago truncatula]RHN54172.1 putative pentatricopeptide [Medicago truncatula]
MTPLLGRRVNKIEGLVSLLNSKQILSSWLITMRHFSFNDNFRGGNIKQAANGKSDDEFFRQRGDTNFNENGGNRNEEGFDIRQRLEESSQTRVLRGQKPINQPHSNSQEFNRSGRRPRFDGNRGNKSSQIDLGFQGRNADETGRDGGHRGNKSPRIDLGFQGRNVAETGRDGGQSGDSFLDKFKFDFDDKIGSQSDVEASSQLEEARAVNSSNFNQPAQESMPQDADAIFNKMKETGLIPNAVAMLDGLCKDGNFQEALKLFGLMREKGTIPDIVIYTAVVDGYTKAHKADDAIRIFRKMQSNSISPNAFSYTVLIQGLYKCSKLHDAVEFCVEMLEAGHSLNVTTFVGLVDGFCKENGIEEAKGVIKTLIGKGFAFDEKAVRVFLDKKAPFSPSIWEAIFGKKAPQIPF